ncbi:MAG: RNA 2',3'-cyclic phosphodiesterase [Lachnospiraceae bacterium]|nr:RNA 2',3'-cyclic phosphodiesterase [Lachnospiraceae bacterium]
MRLFIAVELNRKMCDELLLLQKNLSEHGVTGNYTRPENLHITLAFIGEYSDPEYVMDALEKVDLSSFAIELKGTGNFGDLIFADLEGPEAMYTLVKNIRHQLADAGIPFDKKRFRAHITLVRKADTRKFREREDITPGHARMIVDRVSLMRSDRGKKGMIYTEMGCIYADR